MSHPQHRNSVLFQHRISIKQFVQITVTLAVIVPISYPPYPNKITLTFHVTGNTWLLHRCVDDPICLSLYFQFGITFDLMIGQNSSHLETKRTVMSKVTMIAFTRTRSLVVEFTVFVLPLVLSGKLIIYSKTIRYCLSMKVSPVLPNALSFPKQILRLLMAGKWRL